MTTGPLATLLVGVAFVLIVSLGAGTGEEQRIRDLYKGWSAAAGSKDAAETASFYADDGSLPPFNDPIVNGKTETQETWAGLTAKAEFARHFGPTCIVVVLKPDDLAYDIGTFETTMNDDRGKLPIEIGNYLVAWRKQKPGEWIVEADCFKTDK